MIENNTNVKNIEDIKRILLNKRDTYFFKNKGKAFYLCFEENDIYVCVNQKEKSQMTYTYKYIMCFDSEKITFKSVKNFNWYWHVAVAVIPVIAFLIVQLYIFGIISAGVVAGCVYLISPKRTLKKYLEYIESQIINS